MRIAILGGGITGLTSAYYLGKKGHEVIVFEKEAYCGGLASGFKQPNWDWYLDKTYHHIFANDSSILNFASEIGFDKIFFKEPETASLYELEKTGGMKEWASDSAQTRRFYSRSSTGGKGIHDRICFLKTYPLDTPFDFLRFPLLSFPEKMRAGIILAFLKISPYFSFYERQTAEKFLKKTMGNQSWEILWQELFRKKFGKYAENILASFIWARIKKRTKSLGYIEGGFQAFVDYLEDKAVAMKNVTICKSSLVIGISTNRGQCDLIIKSNNKCQITKGFDKIISTLPTNIFLDITKSIIPSSYEKQLRTIQYMHNISFILETQEPLLDKTYWLNIAVKEFPMTVLVQHTNFIDKKQYGGNHILYIGKYVDDEDQLLRMNENEMLQFFLPYLQKINPSFHALPVGPLRLSEASGQASRSTLHVFKTLFTQQIFDRNFVENRPDLETPLKNIYNANLDMSYPYDRGTNFAVEVGKKVREYIE